MFRMRVDAHTHFFPEPYRKQLRDRTGPFRLDKRGDHPFIVHPDGGYPLAPGFVDVAARLEWMDQYDIDATVVSISNPNPNEGPLSAAASTSLIRAANEGFATLQDEHPDHILALGSLPLREPEAALAELDRIDRFGLAGVALPTSLRGEPLSSPDLEPVFGRLDALDLPVFLHPSPNALSRTLTEEESALDPALGFPLETSFQVGRLLFDGFFDRYDFDVLIAHLGGALPYLVGRFERGRQQHRRDATGPPNRPILEYVEEFYLDTISFHLPAMRAAIETVGTDHLLFGSDYPYGIEDAKAGLADIEGLALSAEERADILGGNAVELFGH